MDLRPGRRAAQPPAASLHIQKLAGFAKAGKRVPWAQIYRVPDYVWFAHKTHSTEAGISCEQCHGPGAEREQLFKEKSINMVACMDCHTKHKASNECNLCHDPG